MRNEQTDQRRGQNHRSDIYGNQITHKSEGMVRMLLHNTSGIGFCTTERTKETKKMETLRKFTITHKVDILALTETNRNWDKETEEYTIWNAIRKWKSEARTYAAHNRTDKSATKLQYGGTSISLFENTVRHKQTHGVDERRLGRWTWTTLGGKDNQNTVIISAYCPCPSTGELSVWTQHLTAMLEWKAELPQEVDTPRKLFWHDLSELVTKFNEEGYNIILAGDYNSEFSEVQEWMIQQGLVEIICEQHGYETAPATHLRSKESPIDGIYCTPQLRASQSGYLSFSSLGGDHRGLWVDIPDILIYGYKPQSCSMAHARRLKLEDPRIVEKYNDTLHKLLVKNEVYPRMAFLHQQAVYPAPVWFQHEYEEVDIIFQNCMEDAESKCRKFKCGNVPWSSLYQEIYDTIDYWTHRLRIFNKHYKKRTHILYRMQEKLGIE